MLGVKVRIDPLDECCEKFSMAPFGRHFFTGRLQLVKEVLAQQFMDIIALRTAPFGVADTHKGFINQGCQLGQIRAGNGLCRCPIKVAA